MAFGQNEPVHFLHETQEFSPNIEKVAYQLATFAQVNGKYIGYLHFSEFLSDDQHAELEQMGVHLVEYIPNKTYLAEVETSASFAQLTQLNVDGFYPVDWHNKLGKRLAQGTYPEYAIDGNKIKISAVRMPSFNHSTFENTFISQGFEILYSDPAIGLVSAKMKEGAIRTLAEQPYVKFLDTVDPEGEPESDDGRNLHRSNAIDVAYAGGYHFDGSGVTIAINDDGFVGPHIDFEGRVDQSDVATDFTGTHGDMTAGIAGGAGNLDPTMRGMAPNSFMHIRRYRSNMSGTVGLHTNDSVMVFSSSYSNGCNAGYTNTTRRMDEEIWDYPTLLQVFSAGNSNNNDCGYGAGNQWGNITGGHKIAKNVIAVANLFDDDALVSSSSRGPASDGRIKPDLAAHGQGQMSTDPDNTYASGGGTSAACPGVTGVTAQLIHAYRTWNNGQSPNSALIKAAMMNTANDLGTEGPDFRYGFGKVNALKALQLIEEGRYFSATVQPNDSNTHSITIPANVLQARIMVYWAEPEASTSAALALVNNLDASIEQGGTTFLPYVLDHTPNATTLGNAAYSGIDSINNVEQIALNNPTAGTYNLKVKGSALPFGSAEYFVVYEFMTDEIVVTYPTGGEGLIAGSNERIHWDAFDRTTGNFSVEISLDGGSNWSSMGITSPGTRIFDFTAPNTITGNALVRVTRGNAVGMSSQPFTIMARPSGLQLSRVCTGSNTIDLIWNSVNGAVAYDVFMLGNTHMDSIMTVTTNTASVVVQDITEEQWFAVRARGAGNAVSKRTIAEYFEGYDPNSACFLSCESDHDVGVQLIETPETLLVPCADDTTSTVKVVLENIGLFTESNFDIHYQLGSLPVVTETVSGSVASSATLQYTFNTPMELPATGDYTLRVWTSLSTDSTDCNDLEELDIRVSNKISNYPFSEDFDAGAPIPSGEIINPDEAITWDFRVVGSSSGGGTQAIYVNNYEYDDRGQLDFFKMSTVDLSGAADGMLYFDVAYTGYNNSSSDSLKVELSTDCGTSYQAIYGNGGSSLATTPSTTNDFVPLTSSQWRRDSVSLDAFIGQEVVIRFVNRTDYGNNMYLDNIQILSNPDTSNDVGTSSPILLGLEEPTLKVMPNPAQHHIQLKGMEENTLIQVLDLTGRVVLETTVASEQELVDVSELAAGTYSIIKPQIPENRSVKFTVIH